MDLFFRDERVLEMLYAEAKYNIIEGRYPCEMSQYIMLGSIQARIELGPYNPQFHTINFFRFDSVSSSSGSVSPDLP